MTYLPALLKTLALASLPAAAGGVFGCSTVDGTAGSAQMASAEGASCALAGGKGSGAPAPDIKVKMYDDCCAADTVAVAAPATPAAAAVPATRPTTGPAAVPVPPATKPSDAGGEWKSLFDGKALTNWKPSGFAGQGEVEVKDGQIVIPVGESLSGVTYTGEDLPKVNFEVEVEAQRAEGHDFFCGLTVPAKDAHVSLIVGGWGGAVVGLSCIDGEDAAHNDTTQYMKFETNKWYRVRLRVLPEKIQAWIDDKKVVNANTKGKKVDIRTGIDESRPLGVATYQTTANVRSVKIRKVDVEGQ